MSHVKRIYPATDFTKEEYLEIIALGYHFARKFQRRFPKMPLDDLQQNCVETLLKHYRDFDPLYNVSKTTYFYYWLKADCARNYKNELCVHMSARAWETHQPLETIYLDALFQSDDHSMHDSRYEPITEPIALDQLEQSEYHTLSKKFIAFLLSNFLERESDIFQRRIDGQTLEEIGFVYGLSRERIRQIEQVIMRKAIRIFSHNRIRTIEDLARFMQKQTSAKLQTFEWTGARWIRCELYKAQGRIRYM